MAHPTHAYRTPSTYVVTLTVGNGQTSAKSLPASVKVSDPNSPVPPAANFDFQPRSAEVGQAVRFNDASVGRVTEWLWDWGDGTRSSGRRPAPHLVDPEHLPGDVDRPEPVRGGFSDQDDPDRGEGRAAKALFDFSPKAPIAGNPVQFTDLSSGGPSSWTWDFGDGSGSVGRSPLPSVQGGEDLYRQVDGEERQGDLRGQPAGAGGRRRRQAASPDDRERPQCRGQPEGDVHVQRHDRQPDVADLDHRRRSHRDRSDAEWSWPEPGNYAVTLTARNAVGEDSVSVTIPVARAGQRLKAEFSVRPGRNSQDAALPGQPVQFLDASEGKPTTYTWDWGDGTMPLSGTSASPTHIYARAGTFNARLTVSSPGVASDTVTHPVFVSGPADPPVADFTASPAAPRIGETVTFTDASATRPRRRRGGGTSGRQRSTDRSPTHVYAKAGPVMVTLTVDNRNGQTATKSLVMNIGDRAPTAASFTITPTGTWEQVAGVADVPRHNARQRDDADLHVPHRPLAARPAGAASPTPSPSPVTTVSMKVCVTADPTNCATATQALTIQAAETAPTVNVDIGGLIDKGTLTGAVGQQLTFSAATTGNPTTIEWMIEQATAARYRADAVHADRGRRPGLVGDGLQRGGQRHRQGPAPHRRRRPPTPSSPRRRGARQHGHDVHRSVDGTRHELGVDGQRSSGVRQAVADLVFPQRGDVQREG